VPPAKLRLPIQEVARLYASNSTTDWRETMSKNASTQAAKAVVRRNTEEVQSKGNFDVFEELFADDFVDRTPQPNMTPDKSGPLQGPSGGVSRLPRCHPLADHRRRNRDDLQDLSRHP
jgi:hypothetical protein